MCCKSKARKDPPPDVHVVVSLDYVFAPVTQSAVAQQKPQSSQPQILLVIFLDRIRHHHQPDLIELSLPAFTGKVRAHLERLVHFGVREGFVLPFVPSKA